MSKCCSHGTFLHFSLQSSHLNICYYHQDLHQRPFNAGLRHTLRYNPRAHLLVGASHLPRRQSIGTTLERHPFSGLVDSAGELLHRLYTMTRLASPQTFGSQFIPAACFRMGIDSILRKTHKKITCSPHQHLVVELGTCDGHTVV